MTVISPKLHLCYLQKVFVFSDCFLSSPVLSYGVFLIQLQLKNIFYPGTQLILIYMRNNLLNKLHSAKFCWLTKFTFCYFN